MTKNLKIVAGLIIFALFITGLVFGSKQLLSKTQMEAPKYKVGIILPLSGDLASLGESTKNGVLLALKNSKLNEKIEVVFEDDHFDPTATVASFNKLTSIDGVNALICFASGPCSAIAPLAENNKTPLIAIASNPKIQENKNFVVRLEIAPSEEAKTLLAYLKTKQYNRIASIITMQDGVQAGYAELKKDQFYTDKEAYSENVAPDLKDFRANLTKILEQKPDLIFVGLLLGQAGDFGRQAKEMGYTGDFIGLNFLEGEETLTAAKGSLDNLVYTNAKETELAFNQLYENTYHKAKMPGAAHVYDALNLINQALEQNKSSNEELAKYLNSIKDYNGALGTFSSTLTHEFTLPVMLKTIKNNQFTTY